jgi:hypothetical protein
MKKLLTIFLTFYCFVAIGQTEILNRMSGKDVRDAINGNFDTLFNQKKGYINVKDYGAVGDGITDDRLSIENAWSEALTNEKVLFFPNGTYYVSDEMLIEHTESGTKSMIVEGNGSTIITDMVTSSHDLIKLHGNIESYYEITTPITIGRNWFVCNSLASELSPGDHVKIFSDQPFNDSLYNYNEEIGRGEMKIVRNVVDSFVYTSAPFFDTYDTAKWYDNRTDVWQETTVSVAKVNPITIDIKGLTIRNTDSLYTGIYTQAVELHYLKDSRIQLNIYNFSDYGITAAHVYNCVFDVNIYNVPRGSYTTGDGAPGYGFQLQGTSMNNLIRGNIEAARHCFAYNGIEGVAWGNVISINGFPGRQNPVIDCHSPCGSIIFKDCNIYGGEIVDIETSFTTSDPESVNDDKTNGIGIGARYCYIHDCNFFNMASTAISFRLKHEVYLLDIKNITGTNCTSFLALRPKNIINGGFVKRINIDGVRGDWTSIIGVSGESSYTGEDLYISNVNISNMASCLVTDSDIKNIYFKNCSFTDPVSTHTSLYFRNIKNLHFENVTWKGWENVSIIDIRGADNLYLNDCTFDSTSTYIVLFSDSDGSAGTFPNIDTVMQNVVISGCKFINTVSGATSRGILNLPDYSKINNYHFTNNIVEYNYYGMAGTEVGVDKLYISGNQFNPNYKIVSPKYTSKIYADDGYRSITAGTGSPEGSVTARIGSMYLREDGSTNTTIYIKTTGTGNTGWTAK